MIIVLCNRDVHEMQWTHSHTNGYWSYVEQRIVELKGGTNVNFHWSRREIEADTPFRMRETVYLVLCNQ